MKLKLTFKNFVQKYRMIPKDRNLSFTGNPRLSELSIISSDIYFCYLDREKSTNSKPAFAKTLIYRSNQDENFSNYKELLFQKKETEEEKEAKRAELKRLANEIEFESENRTVSLLNGSISNVVERNIVGILSFLSGKRDFGSIYKREDFELCDSKITKVYYENVSPIGVNSWKKDNISKIPWSFITKDYFNPDLAKVYSEGIYHEFLGISNKDEDFSLERINQLTSTAEKVEDALEPEELIREAYSDGWFEKMGIEEEFFFMKAQKKFFRERLRLGLLLKKSDSINKDGRIKRYLFIKDETNAVLVPFKRIAELFGKCDRGGVYSLKYWRSDSESESKDSSVSFDFELVIDLKKDLGIDTDIIAKCGKNANSWVTVERLEEDF